MVERCPTCKSKKRGKRKMVLVNHSGGGLSPCSNPWHRWDARKYIPKSGAGIQNGKQFDDFTGQAPERQGGTERCTCPPEFRNAQGSEDPDCPVHGRPEVCPTCGSDDPTVANWPHRQVRTGTVVCPDPFHSTTHSEESS